MVMDMRYLHVFGISAVVSVVLILAAREASAEDRPVGGVPRNHLPGNLGSSRTTDMPPACRNGCFSWEGGHGGIRDGFRGDRFHGDHFRGGFSGFWVEDRDPVVIEREVVHEVPVAVPAAEPAPPPREAYVIGKTYASLPGSCMKLIEEGVSFYYCSGEWYRQVGEGRAAMYRAVKREL